MVKTDVLLVEDSPALAQAYVEFLHNEPITVAQVGDGQSAMQYIAEDMPQLIVLDLQLPDMNGMQILEHIHTEQLPIDVIVATGHGSKDDVMVAMQQGAIDFLEKPFSADRLITTVRNALERKQLHDAVGELTAAGRDRFQGFVGSSPAMQVVYQTIEQVAGSSASVFISGESGTGKEVCAEAIHKSSDRIDGPFIALNCAAIPKDLVESEIFGHVKGAFTGAVNNRDGAAKQADGGTLFLDEIAEMDIALQAKLLRFIQTQTFRKVGGSKTETVDVRFICATNRDALQEVAAGRFREDLYYRLNVINIDMPPLRKRGQDIVRIAEFFAERFAADEGKDLQGITQESQVQLMHHHWPGNVRELQNIVRRAVVMHRNGPLTIEIADLEAAPVETVKPAQSISNNTQLLANIKPLWQVEKDAIEQAIELCDGNIPKAAALLGVSPSTIYRKIQSWSEAG